MLATKDKKLMVEIASIAGGFVCEELKVECKKFKVREPADDKVITASC